MNSSNTLDGGVPAESGNLGPAPPEKSYKKLTLILFLLAVLTLIVLLLHYAYYYQHRLIYRVQGRGQVPEPSADAHIGHFKEIVLKTPDGLKLHGYYLRAENPDLKKTICYFHGIAGNVDNCLRGIQRLRSAVDCNVFMISYRGYGMSEGEPSERGIKIDTQTGLEWLLANSSGKLIAYGFSMGGAIAIDLVASNPGKFHALIIQNTFTALPDVIASFLLNELFEEYEAELLFLVFLLVSLTATAFILLLWKPHESSVLDDEASASYFEFFFTKRINALLRRLVDVGYKIFFTVLGFGYLSVAFHWLKKQHYTFGAFLLIWFGLYGLYLMPFRV